MGKFRFCYNFRDYVIIAGGRTNKTKGIVDIYHAVKSIRKVHHSKTSKEKVLNYSSKMDKDFYYDLLKGALSVLRQFLTTKSPLKITKNAFYMT